MSLLTAKAGAENEAKKTTAPSVKLETRRDANLEKEEMGWIFMGRLPIGFLERLELLDAGLELSWF